MGLALMAPMMRGLLIAAVVCASACHKSTPAAPAAAAPAVAKALDDGAIEVVVNGKPSATWTADNLAGTGAVTMTNHNGQSREGWPLKSVTRVLLGDKARVIALDAGDERVAIDERAWNDTTKMLVLRLSHRGEYKAHWVQSGHADEAFLKNVRRIEVVQ
jgi:hypothetical protein